MQICQSLIGGKSVKSNLPIIEKRYPATGEVIAHIEPANDAMLNETVAIASQAPISWAKTKAFDRAKILHEAANLIREANDELAHLEVRDVVKVFSEAVSGDVPSGTGAFALFCRLYHRARW